MANKNIIKRIGENRYEVVTAIMAIMKGAVNKKTSKNILQTSPEVFYKKIETIEPKDISKGLLAIITGTIQPVVARKLIVETPPENIRQIVRVMGTSVRPTNISQTITRVINATREAGIDKSKLPKLNTAVINLRRTANRTFQPEKIHQIIDRHYPENVLKGIRPIPEYKTVNTELRLASKPPDTNIEVLFRKRNKNNSPPNSYIAQRLNYELNKAERMNRVPRTRRLGELLHIVPSNFPGRRRITSLLIGDIRHIANTRSPETARRKLLNIKRNIQGPTKNKEILTTLSREYNRVAPRRTELVSRVPNTLPVNNSARRSELNRRHLARLSRQVPAIANTLPVNNSARRSELNRRHLSRLSRQVPAIANTLPVNNSARRSELNRRHLARVPPLPPLLNVQNLPEKQQKAFANIGGVEAAANVISQVPGGIPAVAKAAQSINELGHKNAVNIHENHPIAVEAVKALGGHENAIRVVEGLRTISRKTKKTKSPRKNIINAVLNEARKMNLAPVVARMITKTGKIKNTLRNYKKNYNKKIIKSAILRTSLANVARRSAQKKIKLSAAQVKVKTKKK